MKKPMQTNLSSCVAMDDLFGSTHFSRSCGKKHIFGPLNPMFTIAPLTNQNKPAVWAATPREAG